MATHLLVRHKESIFCSRDKTWGLLSILIHTTSFYIQASADTRSNLHQKFFGLMLLFVSIFFTSKSSTTITDLVFASLVVSLCKKSLRIFRFVLCKRANFTADFFLLLDPYTFRLCFFDARLRRFRLLSKGFGAYILSPFERAAKQIIPISTPTASPSTGVGSAISSSTVKLTYQRSASLVTVADKIFSEHLDVSLRVSIPNLGSCTFFPSALIVPVSLKLSRSPLRLKEGKPICCPCFKASKEVLKGTIQVSKCFLRSTFRHFVHPGKFGGF